MDFIYIITKQEFTSLYRFGFIPIIQEKILEIKGLTQDKIETDIIQLFMSLPFFVGDEEYLFIGFNKFPDNNGKIYIYDVLEIIPLTNASRYSLQSKFDKKIFFSEAKFENVVQKVELYIDYQERINGAKAFWELSKVQEPFNEMISNNIIKEAYQKRIDGIKSDSFASDFFVHSLVYERYEPFPKSDLGFFYDVGEIFAHSKQKKSFKGSGYHTFIEQNRNIFESKNLVELSEIISSSADIIKFTEQLTINGHKNYIITALFLKFKSDLLEKDTIKGSETGQLIGLLRKKNQFISELNAAIYLIGSFFGYSKFYDDLYELIGLNIFKSPAESQTFVQANISSVLQTESIPNLDSEFDIKVKTIKSEIENQNKVELSENTEFGNVVVEASYEISLIDQIKELLNKQGGQIKVQGEHYKVIQNIVAQKVNSTTGFKKADYLNKINELTDNSFDIDLKKEMIKIKAINDLFANA